MCGAILSFPNTPSWRGDQLKPQSFYVTDYVLNKLQELRKYRKDVSDSSHTLFK